MKHIDEWLDEPANDENERLAKEWLNHFRRPAVDKDYDWLSARVLSCEYHGERYRCIGASRLGDVWLTKDFSRENGYDLRIDVAECSAWQMTPNDQAQRPTGCDR
jgi:hypothetical protein